MVKWLGWCTLYITMWKWWFSAGTSNWYCITKFLGINSYRAKCEIVGLTYVAVNGVINGIVLGIYEGKYLEYKYLY